MELDPMPKRQVYLSDEGDAQAKSSIISFFKSRRTAESLRLDHLVVLGCAVGAGDDHHIHAAERPVAHCASDTDVLHARNIGRAGGDHFLNAGDDFFARPANFENAWRRCRCGYAV